MVGMRSPAVLMLLLGTLFVACSSSSGAGGTAGGDGGGDSGMTADAPAGPGDGGIDAASDGGGTREGGGPGADGGLPAGWLYTNGAKIYVSDGAGGGKPWMGRGVNIDDIFFCGYDNTLWMPTPDKTLEQVVSGLVSGWKPTFVRISLSMDSYPMVVSWLSNAAQYATPMTGVIDAIGANPGVYVLVTLRSDASMIGQDTADGDPEATGVPSDSTTTPDKTKFPTGTDAVYQALVDTFGSKSFVLFGLTNEPGGNKQSNTTLSAAMSHAVGVIRAEEDKSASRTTSCPCKATAGRATSASTLRPRCSTRTSSTRCTATRRRPAPTRTRTSRSSSASTGASPTATRSTPTWRPSRIPNIAWDFDSYSNCAPDLLQVNQSDTNLMPTAWGTTVQTYLLAH